MTKLKKYILAGIFFVLIVGSLFHFLYAWSGKNFFIGLFTAVNESTWEHMKLLFFPMLIYSAFAIPRLRTSYPCIPSALLSGLLLGFSLIPVFFYTYTGILGYHLFILDLLTFAVSVLLAFWASWRLARSCRFQKYTLLLYILTAMIAFLFIIFTGNPPAIGLFAEPGI